MPQEETQEIRDLRRQMREGRTPLLEAIRETYPLYLLARKGYNRKHEEVREQLGLLNSTFSASIKKLRESSRNTEDSGEGMITLYETLSKQAKAVAAFIEKELPGLRKLYEPVGEKYAAYQQALHDYNAFMARWEGHLPESDLSGRALELVQQDIEKSLR
jgi:uncharacterized phage infection (PIP) family protein YhgE